MITGVAMHCADAPRMIFAGNGGYTWIALSSGAPGAHLPESALSIHVRGRDPSVVQRAVDAFNAAMDGAMLLPIYPGQPNPGAADVMTDRDPLRLGNRTENGDISALLDGVARDLVGAGL